MSKTHFQESVNFAARMYRRVSLRYLRSHTAVQMFVATLAIAVREARSNPEVAQAMCRQHRVCGKRLEVRVARLIAGRRNGHQDQIPRWANAAAYVADPPNGDPIPRGWREAARYIQKRGGVRALSNLYAARDPAADWKFYLARQAGSDNEWYTPPYIFPALGCRFDLDPASPPGGLPWIPADHYYSEHGLEREWFGFVWLNAPYGRCVLLHWVAKFARHGNGIALVPDRTQSQWWQRLVAQADLVLCLDRRVSFLNEKRGERTGYFPIGTHLVGIGERAVEALTRAHNHGLGLLIRSV